MFPLILTVLNTDYIEGYYNPFYGLLAQAGVSRSIVAVVGYCAAVFPGSANLGPDHIHSHLREKRDGRTGPKEQMEVGVRSLKALNPKP